MTIVSSIRLKLMTVVMLGTLALAVDNDAHHVGSLAAKMHCNCGCVEVLSECSHAECKAKEALKREIATALQQGQTDEQVLEAMSGRYGATILLNPPFRGFDTLLWIVPIAGALIGLGVFVWHFLPRKQ